MESDADEIRFFIFLKPLIWLIMLPLHLEHIQNKVHST